MHESTKIELDNETYEVCAAGPNRYIVTRSSDGVEVCRFTKGAPGWWLEPVRDAITVERARELCLAWEATASGT